MTVIQVAIPVLRGKRRFHVEKGKRWSLVEHLMLDAVAKRPASALELAERSALPRRVVVEAFIRLMRVGWVELAPGADGLIFGATDGGRAQIEAGILQAPTTMQPRRMGFVIDQATGSVFRRTDIAVRHWTELEKTKGQHQVFLEKSPLHEREDLTELFAALEGEDETIVRVEPSAEKLVERFAVVSVTNGVIEGLPARAGPELRAAILRKAEEALKKISSDNAGSGSAAELVPEKPHSSAPALALFEQADLIIDATDHKAAFERALRNAREEVIIHSTFVSEHSIPTVLPLLLAATAKGTRVTILWGQDDEKTAVSTSRAAINKLQTAVDEAGRSAQINIHRFTTRSHAKVLIADDGAGRWSAIVGSCNWLSSGFDSFEASIRLRDRALVGQAVRHVAALSLGSPGVWHEGATDLTVLGRRIESKTAESGRTAKMRLILSADHGALVLEARDKAQRRIFVTSHRIGLAGRPMVIIPALSAAKSTQVRAELYYGRPTGVLSGVDAADLAIEFARQGVGIKPTYQPRLHAKVLAWDDDSLAVTSQNWLSEDPAEGALRREIGVFVESNKVADFLIRRFEHARQR
jgi:cardiolipin synthase